MSQKECKNPIRLHLPIFTAKDLKCISKHEFMCENVDENECIACSYNKKVKSGNIYIGVQPPLEPQHELVCPEFDKLWQDFDRTQQLNADRVFRLLLQSQMTFVQPANAPVPSCPFSGNTIPETTPAQQSPSTV